MVLLLGQRNRFALAANFAHLPPSCLRTFFYTTLDLELCSAQFGCFRGEGRKGWQWIGNDLCRPALDPAPQIYALFCRILSRQMFTRFLRNPSKKICNMMFKTKGGAVKGFLNNVQKNCRSGGGWLPLFRTRSLGALRAPTSRLRLFGPAR